MAGAATIGLAGCSSLQSITRFAEKEKLNVLFIMTDQHNAHVMGCDGNKVVRTPNMDRLASEGVNFTRAFTQTGQCCPARYTAWTGRYAHSHGCRWNGVREPLSETTIGEVFKESGYVTASIGKHHMRHPLAEHGFDHVIDTKAFYKRRAEMGSPHPYNDGDWMETKISNSRVGASAATNEQHPAGFWTDETIKFLRENKDKPFCAWYSFHGPHTPITPSQPWADMYSPDEVPLPGNFNYERDESTMPAMLINPRRKGLQRSEEEHRKVLAYYYGLVSQIDYNIGRVLDELETLGLADKTIVY